MFKKTLIIGCGLIGSSILRAIHNKKLSKSILVFEKSAKNISKIKKIKSNIEFVKILNNQISDVDLAIICTPMSEYKKIIPKLNKNLKSKCLITDVGSTKANTIKLKNSVDTVFNQFDPQYNLKIFAILTIPVFLHITPEPYPLENVIEKWLLSVSDVLTCTVDGEILKFFISLPTLSFLLPKNS